MAKKQASNTPAKKEVPTAPATDVSNTVAGGQDGLPAPDSSAADKAAIPGADVAPPATPPAPDTTQEQAGAGETQDPPITSSGKEPDPVNGLRITAKREGFRRSGRAWSKQPTEIPLAGLSDADIAALKAESMLTVEEVVLP